ncbi:hypothetical protein L202_08019 [Cryptococcus amylolentus CBS 6039]|uniref:Uncharacterized protein n=1 Tax=Cryptococcus amylolentus CBS 6039 TaxID=1295533 RepID=A0A1E3HB03_9TREE|nr:hypothetical protein L202_08019 [Cryptococcus amylolentus CBS 6039]ODN73519.1 hypothetical protein L202_08019 [Cryptococcus amylolentus CBS 6039]
MTLLVVPLPSHNERLNDISTLVNANLPEWRPFTVLRGGEPRGCAGWNPAKPESEDPVGCLKARQYGQTQRVLEREIAHEPMHWRCTIEHNLDTLKNMSKCFLPVSDPNFTPCPERPLVISGWWYTAVVLAGGTSGETIWQRSIVDRLEKMGYFWLAFGPYEKWIQVAEMMPDVYKTLWGADTEVVACATDPRCVAKEHYVPPEGSEDLSIGVPDEERGVIPLWALNVVDYVRAFPLTVNVRYRLAFL